MQKLETAPEWTQYLSKAVNIRHDESLKSLLNRINDEYYYWDKVKYQNTPIDIKPEELWSLIKLGRVSNSRPVQFGKHKFSFNLTDSVQKGLHEFDLHIGGHLGSQNIIPEEDKKRYLISSIMEEAIASSQIEGAVTTRKQAKEMLRKNLKPRNTSEQMILNNYITIKRIVEKQHEPLSTESLFEIHRLIANQTLEDANDVGKYRSNNDINVVDVIDGEIIHTPPDYKELPALMQELFDFFNNNNDSRFIHPIVKGCIIHFMIGYIHPFVDGNGRTARALFYWYLLKNGYWLTEYLSISRLIVRSKNKYAQAFIYTENDDNDLTYFIHYKVKTMQYAYKELKDYIQRKITEKKQIVSFQKIDGINERQALIIKWLVEDPDIIFYVKEIETRFNVSNQTARTDIMGLEEKGYLKSIDMNKKTKGYIRANSFDEILKKELPV